MSNGLKSSGSIYAYRKNGFREKQNKIRYKKWDEDAKGREDGAISRKATRRGTKRGRRPPRARWGAGGTPAQSDAEAHTPETNKRTKTKDPRTKTRRNDGQGRGDRGQGENRGPRSGRREGPAGMLRAGSRAG